MVGNVRFMREKLDYTKWQQERFADTSSEKFLKKAVEYAKKNPFKKKERQPPS